MWSLRASIFPLTYQLTTGASELHGQQNDTTEKPLHDVCHQDSAFLLESPVLSPSMSLRVLSLGQTQICLLWPVVASRSWC